MASGRARGTTALQEATGTSLFHHVDTESYSGFLQWRSILYWSAVGLLEVLWVPGPLTCIVFSIAGNAREIGHLVHLRGQQYRRMGSKSCWPWPTSQQWGHGSFMWWPSASRRPVWSACWRMAWLVCVLAAVLVGVAAAAEGPHGFSWCLG